MKNIKTSKTYAESQKEPPFDWNSFLNMPYKRFDFDKLGKAKSLAGNWITCACGNQCDVIPRHSEGTPDDLKLANLGVSFYTAIQGMFNTYGFKEDDFAYYVERAKELLTQIEFRSSEIILELKKSQT